MTERRRMSVKAIKDRTSNDAFDLGTGTGSRSFEIESWSYVQHKNFVLHLLQKAEKCSSTHPVIPTTQRQRLAYISGYVTSPFKIQMNYIQQMNFSGFFWLYLNNIIFRSLSINYLHAFLAAYSPDAHFYGSKMVPLFTGISWQVVLCGLTQLVACVDILTIMCHYCVTGFLYASPWNRCAKPKYKLKPADYSYHCLNIETFLNLTKNNRFSKKLSPVTNSVIFYANHYWIKLDNGTNYIFTGGPMSYYMRQYVRTSVLSYESYEWIAYFAFMWLAGALFYKQIYKKYVWQTLLYTQRFLLFQYLATILVIMWMYLEEEMASMSNMSLTAAVETVMDWDCDFFSESVTGPPVIQILLSRSKDQVDPSRDSAMITAHNAFFYLFQGLTNYKVKQHVESFVGMPVLASWFNEYPIFYFWPFFFYHMFMGALFCRIFYITTFIVEFLLFIITYQLLIDMIVCEWRKLSRWKVSFAMSAAGLFLSIVLNTFDKIFLYTISNMVTGFSEAIMAFWLYPIGRLLDDMHFHDGARPRFFRRWSLQLVPFYYLYKVIRYFKSDAGRLKEMVSQSVATTLSVAVEWYLVVPIAPLVIGAFYAVYLYVLQSSQNCRLLFKPRPDWGPREHITRQMRKQFDTRDYIASQASRYLSRYLINKTDTEVYRLDARYDAPTDGDKGDS